MELTEYQASVLARAARDISGYLVGMIVDLFQTDTVIDENTVLADLTPGIATYTGYVGGAATVTWAAPTVADDGEVEVLGTVPIFAPSGTAVANSIWGLYCTAAIGGALLFAGRFDNPPLPMASTLDQITLTIRYRPASRSLVAVIS